MRRNDFLTATITIKGVDLRRSPVNRISQKRQAEMVKRRHMMVEKFGPREEWHCHFWAFATTPQEAGGGHMGGINGHELRKRSAGGSITDPENVVLLCDRHNCWVEDNPTQARAFGLVIR